MQPFYSCPSCNERVSNSASAAAHRCKIGADGRGTEQQGLSATLEERLAHAQRQSIQPTQAKLEQDVRSLCTQLSESWDGEVYFVVMLIPKDNVRAVHYGTNITERQKFKDVLEMVKKDSIKMTQRGGPSPHSQVLP